jgi:hypothetical protein
MTSQGCRTWRPAEYERKTQGTTDECVRKSHCHALREGRNDICTSYGGCKNLTEEKVSKRLMMHRTSSRKQGGDHIPVAQLPMRSKTCNEYPSGPQMAIPLSQVQSSVKLNAPGEGETKQCHGDAVYDKRLYTNTAAGVNDDELHCLSEKAVNKRWTACITPSLTNKNGDTSVTQGPTRSRTCNEHTSGHQMAISLH